MTKLACQKSAFSLPDGLHYLNCAYMSPLPLVVQEAGIAGIRRKGVPADITADDFFDDVDEARRLFAQVVHVPDAGRIAVVPSVSYGMSTLVRNTPLHPGQNVVTVRDQFPSNTHPWRRACRESGAEFRIVGPPSEGSDRTAAWNEALLEAIDADSAVVTMGQVHWADGTPFDLAQIGSRAREVGAAFLIDGTQSVGAAPFDIEALRPDAVVCAAYKWLMGPYSIGLTYFGSRYDDGIPLEENWMGREGSRDFAGLVDQGDEYRPGAARFDVGESANFILVPMLIAALQQVLEWGVERINEYCRDLADPVFPGAGHLFGLRLPADVDPAEVRSELQRRNVFVSLRGQAIRVSPHLYNDAADMEALASALQESGAAAHLM